MPISTNAKAFRTKTTVSHTAKIGTRMRAGISGPPCRAIVIANATSVRMPERPSASAAIQTPKAVANWTITVIGTSCSWRLRAPSRNPQAMPAARLPKTVSRNTGAKLAKPSGPAIAVMIASR